MNHYNKYYEGIFWLPDNEEKKIIATLYIDEKGVGIISSLQTLNCDDTLGDQKSIDTILGHISCNDKSKSFSIKLYDSFVTSSTIAFLDKKKYTSHNLYVSGPDSDICKPKFKALLLGSSYLNEFVDYKGLDYNYTGDKKEFGAEFKYNQPDSPILFDNEKYQIYLYARASVSATDRGRSINISEKMFFNIKTYKSHTAKDLIMLKQSMHRLFSILWNKSPMFTNVELKSESGNVYESLNGEKYKEKPFLNLNTISYKYFKENSEKIFENWFDKQERLDLVIKNFFSVFLQPGVLVENKFLTYVSVIENYHKNNISKGSNLKKRLKDILEKSKLASVIEDIDTYADSLKDTRNYHTHLDEKQEEKALSIDGIIKANILLEYIIRELLLKELDLEVPGEIPSSLRINNKV